MVKSIKNEPLDKKNFSKSDEIVFNMKGSTPEKEHKKIYDLLNIPYEIMRPKKWWPKE